MRPIRTWIILRGVGVTAIGLPLAACGEGVLAPHGPIGAAELTILYNATAIMLAVVIPVILLTIGFGWWFRAGNTRARYLPTWEYSGRIEMIVWSIPTLVIIFLGGIAWIGSHDLDPPRRSKPPRPRSRSRSSRSIGSGCSSIPSKASPASIGSSYRPAVPMRFRLTSATVMNSFFVPELGSQIYTMPGMTTQLNLQADQAGVYKGFSAQFSGDGFSDMRFEVAALPADRFASWAERAKAQGNTLDKAAYAVLARPSKAVAPATYAPVAEGLFGSISAGRETADCSPQQEH